MTAQIGVNGIDLDQLLAQGVEGSAGLRKVPAKRGSNIAVPNSHGELHVPGKRYGPAQMALPMWVRGVDPVTGAVPSDAAGRLAFETRLRELIALFVCGELVTLRHTLSDGSAREITGEVTDVIDPTVDGYGRDTLGQLVIGLTCADPFWTDLHNSSAAFTLAAGTSRTLSEFAAATAPMDNLLLSFGPVAAVSLATANGVFFAYDGPISSGRKLVVDTGEWTVTGTVDAGGTWNPGTVPTQHIQRVRHGRQPRFFSLAPSRPLPPVITNTGTATLTGSIVGRQRHLVP